MPRSPTSRCWSRPARSSRWSRPRRSSSPRAGSSSAAALIDQMVCERAARAGRRSRPPLLELGDADVPEMLALTELTQPGPFGPRTHDLGRYIGIRVDGRLAAMAGERMRPDGARRSAPSARTPTSPAAATPGP